MSTKTTYPTCQSVFDAAVEERQRYPLCEGVLKLKEGRSQLLPLLNEMQVIDSYKSDTSDAHRLQLCQSYEIDDWVRTIPRSVAHTLGRTVLPAVAKLGVDGVPLGIVSGLYLRAESDFRRLLASLDTVQAYFDSTTKQQRQREANRTGGLTPLLVEITDYIEALLATATVGTQPCFTRLL